jgi:hypothetical protein
MGLRAWLLRWLGPDSVAPEPLPSRHARREAARRHAAEDGGPPWSDEDRHLRPGRRQVNDTGGLGAGIGGHRTIDES